MSEWLPTGEGDWINLVYGSGLAHLQTLMHKKVHNTLISSFIERWQPETNSFHMPWGEMTVTLHDVALILGLPINGDAAISRPDDRSSMRRFTDFFGIPDDWMHSPQYDKGGVSHRHLRQLCMDDDHIEDPEIVATGFLLYLLGSTICPDKSQNKIPITYLDLVRDHDSVQRTSWGSAALAHLYLALGEASRAGAALVSFCYTLLQVIARCSIFLVGNTLKKNLNMYVLLNYDVFSITVVDLHVLSYVSPGSEPVRATRDPMG